MDSKYLWMVFWAVAGVAGGVYGKPLADQVQINCEYFDLNSGFVMFHVEAKMEKGANLLLF